MNPTMLAKLADVESRMFNVSQAPLLAPLVTATDVRRVWDSYDLEKQRAVIAAILDITILKSKPGGNTRNGEQPLDKATIRVVPATR